MGTPKQLKEIYSHQRRINKQDVPRRNDNLFAIPGQYTLTTEGNQFLQYANNLLNRMLIFGTRESLDFLSNADDWFADLTFDGVPAQFTQLYTVHSLKNGGNVVGSCGLLSNKMRQTC